ncbi:MAG: RHS repeat-associated core domain-containing protein, partial [Candidatus Eisenbacteria bacterium]|nr:RHS repeat-associated core domain-containing protein [Candidatus Eisenbacteria bacterium]
VEYDPVGNRLTRTSTLVNILSKLYAYDMNDRLGSDTYDDQGNTIAATVAGAGGPGEPFTYDYDFENRIVSVQSALSAVALLYDGDGNRVGKTVNGVTKRFLVDDRNPSGYVQVLEELTLDLGLWTLDHVYTYGLDLISQDQIHGTDWVVSFYGYDGHGNVRFLTDDLGHITDTYDYDTFGTLIEQKAWEPYAFSMATITPANSHLATPNNYLYCGEQFDPDLGLYFLRARYMDADRGRFWTTDVFGGMLHDPQSLHKYLYVYADPVNARDPSGNTITLTELVGVSVMISLFIYEVSSGFRHFQHAREWIIKIGAEINIRDYAYNYAWSASSGIFPGYTIGMTFNFSMMIYKVTWRVINLDPPEVEVSYHSTDSTISNTFTYESHQIPVGGRTW